MGTAKMPPKRSIVLGVIGHVDHGKTALVRLLTNMETDRLPEEKRRGISIALGFAHFAVDGATVDLIDMPGHERFVRTMIGGATGIDAVLLVVAANEGVMPQTVEHVEIAGLLGLRHVVVAVTKADLVEPGEAELAGAEAAELAARCGLTGPTPVITSAAAQTGAGDLRAAIVQLLRGADPAPRDDGFFYLPVDRSFSLPGHGTVVTGTLRRGSMSTGDRAALLPGTNEARVRRLQVHGTTVEKAEPGQRVAVNLRGVELAAIGRGMALAPPGLFAPSAWLAVRLRATPTAPPLYNGQRLRLLYGTDETDTVLRLLDRKELPPNESGLAQLRCSNRIILPVGEHIVLRTTAPLRTVAGGRVIETAPRRLRRNTPSVIARLNWLAEAEPVAIIAGELQRAGIRGVRTLEIARLAGLSVPRAEQRLREAGAAIAGGIAAPSAAVENVASTVMRRVATQPEGIAHEQLQVALRGTFAPINELILAKLTEQGAVLRSGRLRLRRTDQMTIEQAAARVAEAFRQGGLAPGGVPDGQAERRACAALVQAGILVRTYDRAQRREILFHRASIENARRQLAQLLTGQGLTVSEIGAALGISRKYSVPLLEYFDAIQFTRRIGDRRVLRQRRSEGAE